MPAAGRLTLLVVLLAFLLRGLQHSSHQNEQSLIPEIDFGTNVLLLTAHPDDEAMFFGPTITSLLHPRHVKRASSGQDVQLETQRSVRLFCLCLSVGNADGLGHVRRQEFGRSLDVLGVDDTRRWLVDHLDLNDDINSHWDADFIATMVEPYVIQNNITTILTFDSQGISSHPNHKSLPRGALHLLSSFSKRQIGQMPRLFALISHPLADKYIGPIAALLAKFDIVTANFLYNAGSKNDGPPRLPVFVAGVREYATALNAMKQHESQLVWFRWLYVLFSRYMWVNEWVELVYDTAGAGGS